jgi:predicted RNase H-like HicB family nuclease
MDTLTVYRKQALKLATVETLGEGEGYVARIPGFRGVVGTGRTKKETLADLESVLAGWIELALKRGVGLPAVNPKSAEMVNAA